MPLALRIAHALSRDDEAEGVATLALCKAVIRHRGSPVQWRPYLAMRIRKALRRWRRKSQFLTNVDLEAVPATSRPEAIEWPPRLAGVVRLRVDEKLTQRETAKRLGISLRVEHEREAEIRHCLAS